MSSILTRAFAIFALLSFTGCQDFSYTADIPKSAVQKVLNLLVPVDLQEKADCPFPAQLTSIEVILDEENNQMGLLVDFTAKPSPPGPPFAPSPKSIGGSISMTGELRFDASAGSFHMDNISVIQISGGDLPEKISSKLTKVVEKITGKYLSENPIYTLDSEKTSSQIAKSLLKSFTVKKDSIQITLGL